jgi:hypothetical protein
MADIHIEKETKLSPDDAMKKFESEVLALPNLKLFVTEYAVDGHNVTFGGNKGVSGTLAAMPGKLVIDVRLEGMAALGKGMVETKLREVLAKF